MRILSALLVHEHSNLDPGSFFSVVDPDPVGSDTFSRIRIKSFRIRSAVDPT
jgi:hypothetical protein